MRIILGIFSLQCYVSNCSIALSFRECEQVARHFARITGGLPVVTDQFTRSKGDGWTVGKSVGVVVTVFDAFIPKPATIPSVGLLTKALDEEFVLGEK